MGIQARNVVRKARKVGHEFKRGSYLTCAVGFLAMQVNTDYSNFSNVAKQYGLKGDEEARHRVIRAVERGFEDRSSNGSGFDDYFDLRWITNKKERALLRRYWNVGKNIAKQAGLPFYD
jgi:hypothetical protein